MVSPAKNAAMVKSWQTILMWKNLNYPLYKGEKHVTNHMSAFCFKKSHIHTHARAHTQTGRLSSSINLKYANLLCLRKVLRQEFCMWSWEQYFLSNEKQPWEWQFRQQIKSMSISALFSGLNNSAFYTHYHHFAHIRNFNANIWCDLVSTNSFKSTAEFIAELSASQPGETWHCLGTFLVIGTGKRGCHWRLVCPGQGCGPTSSSTQGGAAMKNDPVQSVSTAAAEKDFCNWIMYFLIILNQWLL